MPNRSYTAGSQFRYGFNGMEKDASHLVTFYRIYDPRTGRWLSVDPKAQDLADESPYGFSNNMPTLGNDPKGDICIPCLVAKYGANFAVNVGTQMLTAYLFDDKVKDWGSAWEAVDLWDATWESGVDMVGNEKVQMIFNGIKGMFDYVAKVGLSKVDGKQLMISGGIGILEPIVGKAIATTGVKGVKKGLEKLGLKVEDIKSVLFKVGVDGKALSEMFPSLKRVNGSPCGCLTVETKILTKGGFKRISEIKIGDSVLSFNDSLKKFAYNKVTKVYNYPTDTLYSIATKFDKIQATYDHPFLTLRGWIKACDLKINDKIFTKGRVFVPLTQIKKSYSPQVVYNFEVENYHSYVVSGTGYVTHNSSVSPCDFLNPSGFYKIVRKDGKFYIGKGGEGRANISLKERAGTQGGVMQWFEVDSERKAYIFEYFAMRDAGNIKGGKLLNARNSPGQKYFEDITDEAEKRALEAEYQTILNSGPTSTGSK